MPGGSRLRTVSEPRAHQSRLAELQCGMLSSYRIAVLFVILALSLAGASCSRSSSPSPASIPRTADGKPNLQGIWQVRNRAAADLEDHVARHLHAGRQGRRRGRGDSVSAVGGGEEGARTSRTGRRPIRWRKCYLPGVPRIMYMEFPFQIFQTPRPRRDDLRVVAGLPPDLHERHARRSTASSSGWATRAAAGRATRWSSTSRTTTTRRGSTWPATSTARRCSVVERYTMLDADTIQLRGRRSRIRRSSRGRGRSACRCTGTRTWIAILEYQCQAEAEEANGDFERDPRPGIPSPIGAVVAGCRRRSGPRRRPPQAPAAAGADRADPAAAGRQARPAGLLPWPTAAAPTTASSKHAQDFLTPGGRGVVVDPPDGKLPMQPWAKAESESRETARARLRRSDRALLRRRRAALDVRAVAAPDPPAARLRRHAVRAHVVAHRSRSTAAPHLPDTSGCGRATRSAAGRATRWSSRRRT